MVQYIEKGVMGIDLGDRVDEVCLLDAAGEVMRMESEVNTKESLVKFFSGFHGSWRQGHIVSPGSTVPA